MVITKSVTCNNGFIDIHSHILPGVDDGAHSEEQSMRMLRIAAEEGIEGIILSPHQKADRECVTPEGIVRRMKRLQELADAQEIPVRLYPGNEIFYRHGLSELLEEGKIRTLADSHYALIEFFPAEDYSYIRTALGRVSSFGYWPVLAHVERYENVTKSMERLEELKQDTGCLYQINAASLMGETGFSAKRLCRKLLKNGLVEFVATDAHNDASRAPRMNACACWLEKKMGESGMRKLLTDNPRAILEDRLI